MGRGRGRPDDRIEFRERVSKKINLLPVPMVGPHSILQLDLNGPLIRGVGRLANLINRSLRDRNDARGAGDDFDLGNGLLIVFGELQTGETPIVASLNANITFPHSLRGLGTRDLFERIDRTDEPTISTLLGENVKIDLNSIDGMSSSLKERDGRGVCP